MSTHHNASAQIVEQVNKIFYSISNSHKTLVRRDIRNELEDLRRTVAKYFESVPVEERTYLSKFVLLKLLRIARLMSYVDQKDLLPDIYEKSREIYEVVDGDAETLSAIESLVKVGNAEKTFREVLLLGENIRRYEKMGRGKP